MYNSPLKFLLICSTPALEKKNLILGILRVYLRSNFFPPWMNPLKVLLKAQRTRAALTGMTTFARKYPCYDAFFFVFSGFRLTISASRLVADVLRVSLSMDNSPEKRFTSSTVFTIPLVMPELVMTFSLASEMA